MGNGKCMRIGDVSMDATTSPDIFADCKGYDAWQADRGQRVTCKRQHNIHAVHPVAGPSKQNESF